jgi:hypothetical protein
MYSAKHTTHSPRKLQARLLSQHAFEPDDCCVLHLIHQLSRSKAAQRCSRDAAMARPESSRAATRWTIRLIPLFIFGAFGFAMYVVIAHLCGTYVRDSTRPSTISNEALPAVLCHTRLTRTQSTTSIGKDISMA